MQGNISWWGPGMTTVSPGSAFIGAQCVYLLVPEPMPAAVHDIVHSGVFKCTATIWHVVGDKSNGTGLSTQPRTHQHLLGSALRREPASTRLTKRSRSEPGQSDSRQTKPEPAPQWQKKPEPRPQWPTKLEPALPVTEANDQSGSCHLFPSMHN